MAADAFAFVALAALGHALALALTLGLHRKLVDAQRRAHSLGDVTDPTAPPTGA